MTNIAFIGLGIMGSPMAVHLANAGHQVAGYNRTPEKAAPLVDAGGRAAESIADAVRDAEVVCVMVPDSPDVSEVLTGEGGVFDNAKPGTLVIDFSSIRPDVTTQLAEQAAAKGIRLVDAPVSGGEAGAKNAALSIMVGGDPAVFEAVKPLFECMGKTIVHQGPAGAGQHTKAVNQVLIASNMVGVCEAMLYATKAGLDPTTVLQSVGSGAAGSWSLNHLGPRILKRDFEPGFFVEHFIKDMRIALDEAERMNLALPGLALAKQLYEAVRAQGYGRKGTHALMLALEHLSNVKH